MLVTWFQRQAQIPPHELFGPGLPRLRRTGPALIAAWEQGACAPTTPSVTKIFLGGLLLAAHASLRFGDLQRIDFFVSRALVDIICRRPQLPVRKTKAK